MPHNLQIAHRSQARSRRSQPLTPPLTNGLLKAIFRRPLPAFFSTGWLKQAESQFMMPKFIAAVAVAIAISGTPAIASSPDAWRELGRDAAGMCLKVANYIDGKPRGEPVFFEEAVLVIIDFTHPEPHMKRARGAKYCLYNKTTKGVDIQDAPVPGAAAPAAKPKSVRGQALGGVCWSTSIRASLKTPQRLGTPCTAQNDEGDTYNGIVRASAR